jgi:Cys-tRNA(Pro) deacylase
MITPATQALDQLQLPYRLFRHTESVSSLEDAANQRGQAPGQVVRSILFRVGEGYFVMALMAGPAQISWSILRKTLGQSRLTMATEDEVLTVTGYRTGAVSPLGLPTPLRMLADEGVFLPDEISIGSGERGLAIILRSTDLRKALPDVEIGSLVDVK